MKNFIVLMSCCCTFFSVRGIPNTENKSEDVSFYKTDLVCGAASDIGCGTRAKPILLEFMQHDAVKEAFLNHAGTVIAIVWNEGIENKHEISNNVFSTSDQPFLELTGEVREEHLEDFRLGPWYKGKDVDQLSILEAERMADQMTAWIEEDLGFTKNEQMQIREAFQEYIEKSLLAIVDASVIDETGYWRQWETDLTAIGKKLVGEKMPKMQLVPDSAGLECTSNKACCKDGGKSACCKKTN